MTPPPRTRVYDSEPTVHRRCFADRLGVFAAAACAVHCMAAPVVLALAPLVGGIWTSPKTHWVFASISIPAAVSLLWRNLRGRALRARRVLMGLALAGSALIILGLTAPGASWSQGVGVELPLPEWVAGEGQSEHEASCQDECCASVQASESGTQTLFVPLASLVTMLGGVLLVTAHAFALRRHACSTQG